MLKSISCKRQQNQNRMAQNQYSAFSLYAKFTSFLILSKASEFKLHKVLKIYCESKQKINLIVLFSIEVHVTAVLRQKYAHCKDGPKGFRTQKLIFFYLT